MACDEVFSDIGVRLCFSSGITVSSSNINRFKTWVCLKLAENMMINLSLFIYSFT